MDEKTVEVDPNVVVNHLATRIAQLEVELAKERAVVAQLREQLSA